MTDPLGVTETLEPVAKGDVPPPAVNQAIVVMLALPLVEGDALSVNVVGPPLEAGVGAFTAGQPAGVTVT